MRIETLGVFPDMFEPIMSLSIMGRARRAGVFEFAAHDLRDWTHDRHRTVDDAPYGGGQGMLMKCTPWVSTSSSAVKRRLSGLAPAMTPTHSTAVTERVIHSACLTPLRARSMRPAP